MSEKREITKRYENWLEKGRELYEEGEKLGVRLEKEVECSTAMRHLHGRAYDGVEPMSPEQADRAVAYREMVTAALEDAYYWRGLDRKNKKWDEDNQNYGGLDDYSQRLSEMSDRGLEELAFRMTEYALK